MKPASCRVLIKLTAWKYRHLILLNSNKWSCLMLIPVVIFLVKAARWLAFLFSSLRLPYPHKMVETICYSWRWGQSFIVVRHKWCNFVVRIDFFSSSSPRRKRSRHKRSPVEGIRDNSFLWSIDPSIFSISHIRQHTWCAVFYPMPAATFSSAINAVRI